MSPNEIQLRFSNASSAFVKANLDAENNDPLPVLERIARDESLVQDQSKKGAASRVLIRFRVARKRLCDPDNLAIKAILDCLRYAEIISGDEPEKISLEIEQRKCAKGEAESVIVEIYEL